MGEYGIVLGDLNISTQKLVEEFILPRAKQTHPEWGMFFVDRQHAFTVHYGKKLDKDLSMHMDGAEVTFNLCLRNTLQVKDELVFGRINGADALSGGVDALHEVVVEHEEDSALLFL